eukprot:TRINITY_DN71680_c1_g1_i1.p1 TRINITY_DN71680_c1_g1~~TRINITY_DN71680_c1_g1_i1.p1  ORF type:complete len:415 (-),score=93.60 TRINITY_DN71680_c1_g1_i1:204-1370(-)
MDRLSEWPTSPGKTPAGGRTQTSLGMVGSMSFGSLGSSSPTSSKGTKAPQDTSSAMNFLPKLLGRLASIDEKLQMLEAKKVDGQHHQQQVEIHTTQANNHADGIRQLQSVVMDLQAKMEQARIDIDAKAENKIMERTNRQLQELSRTVTRNMEETMSRIQSDGAANAAEHENLHQILTTKASLNQLAEQTARIDELNLTMKTKASLNELQQVAAQLDGAEVKIANLQATTAEKAENDDLQRLVRKVQVLTNTMNDKTNVSTTTQVQQDTATNTDNIAQLRRDCESRTPLTAFAKLQSDVDRLTTVCNAKADGNDAQQLMQESMNQKASLDKAHQELLAQDQRLREIRAKLATLSGHTEELRSISSQLEMCKPDSHMVPLLSADLVDRL